MAIYKLDIKDFENLESLLQISKEISDIYDKLCKLEIDNKKDSKEYNELLKELSKLIEKENKEYKQRKFTSEDCIKYLKILEAKTTIPGMDNRIVTTLKHSNNKMIRRIMLNLLNTLEKNKDFYQIVLNNGIPKDMPKIIESIPKEELLKGVENSVKIQGTLDNDIHSMFLSILEEAISYKSNTNYRTELIEAKYCILFTHKNMESMFIERNFDIPSEIYISSKMMNQLLNQPEISYDLIKLTKLKSMAKQDINKLLNLFDKQYEEHSIFLNSIITECHIRALLSLMENDDVESLNQEIHNTLNSSKYLSKHINDRISETIVINCFIAFKKDKEKVRTLTDKV